MTVGKLLGLHVVAFLLMLTWMGQLPMLGGPPSLLLILAIVIGNQRGWLIGAIAGIFGGGLIDLWLGEGFVHMLGYGVTAAGAGFLGGLYLVRGLGGAILTVFVATWIGQLILAALYGFLGFPQTWEHWQAHTPWLAVYNVALTPLTFWLVGTASEEKRPRKTANGPLAGR